MKLLSLIKNFLLNICKSKLAMFFAFIHLVILIIALVEKGNIYVIGQLEYEPTLFLILCMVNIPSMIGAYVVFMFFGLIIYFILSLFITPICTGIGIGRDIDAYEPTLWILVIYAIWQIQWALIGYWIDLLIKKLRKN